MREVVGVVVVVVVVVVVRRMDGISCRKEGVGLIVYQVEERRDLQDLD